ncbi:branched-chain amino acid ABC transporter permease [Aquabacterium sp. OR-4]|uniref:branched-chain amino acid ABC transporter permease n=1 Tax=Aquabacterium sp. OR-4 TaxID=2978127 RepID=UPI0021B1CE2D|nr:branched-chain amino acid ABC transporter permease [Aquabacterium sp. OR-4]MDT7838232.1 branched-chain amino acid ABC transporter permease [Aquabacterium sp. OR-4]
MNRLSFVVFALVLAVAGATAAAPWLKTPVLLALANGLSVAGVIVLIRAGQVSFGHAMFACLSGYTVAFAARAWHLDALLLVALGTLSATAAGALIGVFMVRYRGIFFGMLNLAFSMVLFSVLGKFGGITGGTDGLRFDRPSFGFVAMEREGFETALLGLALVLALAAGWAVQRYFGSVNGQALAAIKTNETRLEYLGISAKRVFWGGYLLSATLCGLGGSLFALTQGLVTPEMGYWVRSGEVVFIAILGGSAHALGAFIGAFVFEFVKLYAASLLTGAWQLALGLVLIVMVFVAPTGIFGLVAKRLLPAAGGKA